MTLHIRPAIAADFDRIEAIENTADQLFIEAFRAEHWPAADPASERAALPGYLLVAELPSAGVIGFVHVLEIAGHAHLEQLSVSPEHGRHGYGQTLVEAALAEAKRRGYHEVTLRTYAELPWNGPFYAKLGFRETEAETDFLRSLIQVERDLDLDSYGRRSQMSITLD